MKEYYDIVFVVLVYGNTKDIVDFISSIPQKSFSYKVIIVNSFYDECTKNEIQKIATGQGADFINVKNKGYGYGNNKGIEYSTEKYNFRFLVMSNPDIIIKKFNYDVIKKYDNSVVGPAIITSTGKNQNPFYIKNKIFPKMENYFLRKKNKIGYFSIVAINKLQKFSLFYKMKKKSINKKRVYALHGSFLILSKKALDILGQVFDENIFLFCEEIDLAEKIKNNKINAFYDKRLEVYHKEDGSMKFLDGDMYDEEVKSNTYICRKYFNNSKL